MVFLQIPLAAPFDPATPTESGDTSLFTCPGLVEELPLEVVQPVEWSPHSVHMEMVLDELPPTIDRVSREMYPQRLNRPTGPQYIAFPSSNRATHGFSTDHSEASLANYRILIIPANSGEPGIYIYICSRRSFRREDAQV